MKYKLLLLAFISVAIPLIGMKEGDTEKKGPRLVRSFNILREKGSESVSKVKDSDEEKARKHSLQVREYLNSLTEERCSDNVDKPTFVKTLPNGKKIKRLPIYLVTRQECIDETGPTNNAKTRKGSPRKNSGSSDSLPRKSKWKIVKSLPAKSSLSVVKPLQDERLLLKVKREQKYSSGEKEILSIYDFNENDEREQSFLDFPEKIGPHWFLSRNGNIIFACIDLEEIRSYDISTEKVKRLGIFKMPDSVRGMSPIGNNGVCCIMNNGQVQALNFECKDIFSFQAHAGESRCIALNDNTLIMADSNTIRYFQQGNDKKWQTVGVYIVRSSDALNTKEIQQLAIGLSGKRLIVYLEEKDSIAQEGVSSEKYSIQLLKLPTLKLIKEEALSSPFNIRSFNGEMFYLAQIGITRKRLSEHEVVKFKKLIFLNAKTGNTIIKRFDESDDYDITLFPEFEVSPDGQFLVIFNSHVIIRIDLDSIGQKVEKIPDNDIWVIN